MDLVFEWEVDLAPFDKTLLSIFVFMNEIAKLSVVNVGIYFKAAL